MDIRSIANNFEAFVNNWEQSRLQRVLQIANDINALRKSRIINDRVDHLGQSFGTYAPETQKKKERDGNTRPTNNPLLFDSGFGGNDYPHYNFNDTGRTWNQTRAVVKSQSADQIVVRIEPSGDRKQVMEILEGKYGPLNKLSDKELEFIEETINAWIEMDLNNYNLN